MRRWCSWRTRSNSSWRSSARCTATAAARALTAASRDEPSAAAARAFVTVARAPTASSVCHAGANTGHWTVETKAANEMKADLGSKGPTTVDAPPTGDAPPAGMGAHSPPCRRLRASRTRNATAAMETRHRAAAWAAASQSVTRCAAASEAATAACPVIALRHNVAKAQQSLGALWRPTGTRAWAP